MTGDNSFVVSEDVKWLESHHAEQLQYPKVPNALHTYSFALNSSFNSIISMVRIDVLPSQ